MSWRWFRSGLLPLAGAFTCAPGVARAEGPRVTKPSAVASAPTTPVAQPGATSAIAGARPRTQWYGWQTLLSDAAAVTLMAALPIEVGGYAGAGVFVAGAPLIHAAHGQPGRMGMSLALRLIPPVAIGGSIALADSCTSTGDGLSGIGCGIGTLLLGFTVSIAAAATAITLDATVFAKKEARPPSSFAIAPMVLPTRGGATLGLAGTF
jgi:hypothetical protein